jgi:hypothetical protein
MEFVEDLTPFFAQFGDAGTLSGVSVRGIFDAAGTAQLGITSAEPQFQLPSASVPAAIFDATLIIPAGTFKVREAIPDGTGLTLLVLTKVS